MNSVVEDEIGSVLLANADKAEQQSRPAAESLAALRQAGAFALRTPAVHGGAWADPETVVVWLAGLGRV